MKTIFAVLLATGLAGVWSPAWAQGAVAPGGAPAGPAAAEPKAIQAAAAPASPALEQPAERPAVDPRERVSALFQDPPLDIIKTLADQAGLKTEIDSRIQNGMDAAGKPIPKWSEPVAKRWNNVTAREALEELLAGYGMALVPGTRAGEYRISFRTPAETSAAPEPKGPPPRAEAAAPPTTAKPAPARPAAPLTPKIEIRDQLLLEAISTLADSAKIKFLTDPKVTAGKDAKGEAASPYFTNIINFRWENVSPSNALAALLDTYGLRLADNTNTGLATLGWKPAAADEPDVLKTIHLRFANPTNVVYILTNSVVTPGKATADLRTSSLVLKVKEKDFEGIRQVVTDLDTPTPQILIEAQVLETSKNPKTIKGIDWAETLNSQSISFGNGRVAGQTITTVPGTPDSSTTTLPSGRTITTTTPTPYTDATRLVSDLGSGGLGLNTLRGFYPNLAFLNADGVRVALSFLNSDSETEVVATPRAVTLDNEMAKLAVTKLYPNYKITPGSPNFPPSAEITYTNLGTTLEVTPRVAGTNLVSLRVVPEIANIDSVDRKIVSGSVNEANVYVIRRIETRVLIPSGNTLVMGGLISDTRSKTFSKVPLLGDLPLLGLAFRREGKQRNKANLVIFVTPTIIRDTDFQPVDSTFLKTKPKKDEEGPEESAWDAGKPYDWKGGLGPVK